MKICANSSVWMCLLALALVAGCDKKKATPPVPPPPTATPLPTPTPTPEAQETQKSNNEEQPTAAQGTPPPDPGQVADADKSKAKPARPRPTPKKPQQPAQTTTARNAPPPRIVVKPEGPEPSSTPGQPGQISPNPPNTEVSHDQATTEQLLQSSESSINNLKRTLTTDEQAIVAQIRDYVNQSRQAIRDNDLTRAHTLALKAHLLSDELIKRR